MAPALPFPNSDEDGAVPANGNTEALWMVRPLQPGDRLIEVIANPLNEVNHTARDAGDGADRRTTSRPPSGAPRFKTIAPSSEAKRTGRSQEVDGVTLADEGVAGAKIDAESHVTIDVAANETSFTFEVDSSIQPPSINSGHHSRARVAVITMPSNTFREGDTNVERYAEAHTFVFLGRVAVPEVQKRADNHFEVFAAATSPALVRLRGNEALIADLLRKTNWNSLVELMR